MMVKEIDDQEGKPTNEAATNDIGMDTDAYMDTSNEAEELLVRSLIEGEQEVKDAQEEALKRLSPRWEIRIQSERDPIAEETAVYRALAKEVDNRYDK